MTEDNTYEVGEADDDIEPIDGGVKPEKAKGFCTDVFFGAAENFIRDTAARRQPWMAYIALNAPHGPLHAPEEWLARYPDQPPARAAFYAMISNIDDRVGRLRTLLRELGVERDTVFVFTTDNGTATGDATGALSSDAFFGRVMKGPNFAINAGFPHAARAPGRSAGDGHPRGSCARRRSAASGTARAPGPPSQAAAARAAHRR